MEGNAEDDRFSKAAVHRTIAKWSKPTKFHKPFYFISIADTQLGMVQGALGSSFLPLVGWKGGNNVEALYNPEKEMSRLTVQYINRLNPLPVFVIVCGDLVNSMPTQRQAQNLEVKDFKAIFSKLNPSIQLICLCGNHDIGDKPSPMNIDVYKQRFSDDYYSFWYEGVKFIVLNSQLYKFDVNAKQLAKEQDEWLDKQLLEMKTFDKGKNNGSNRNATVIANGNNHTKHGKKDIDTSISSSGSGTRNDYPCRCCVFTHIPPFIEHQNEGEGYFPLGKSARLNLLRRLSKHNCTHWFSGHYHRNLENTYVNKETGKSIECITTAAVGGNITNDENGDPKELNGMKDLRLDKTLSGMRFIFVKNNCMNHCYVSLNALEEKYHLNADDDAIEKMNVARIERDKFAYNVVETNSNTNEENNTNDSKKTNRSTSTKRKKC